MGDACSRELFFHELGECHVAFMCIALVVTPLYRVLSSECCYMLRPLNIRPVP